MCCNRSKGVGIVRKKNMQEIGSIFKPMVKTVICTMPLLRLPDRLKLVKRFDLLLQPKESHLTTFNPMLIFDLTNFANFPTYNQVHQEYLLVFCCLLIAPTHFLRI